MKRLKTELNALVNRGVDRHLRLAVTGLSRSGKTAFITALVNQLLNIHTGARLPLPDQHEERGAYVVEGSVEVAGVSFDAGRMLVFRAGDALALVAGPRGARVLMLGGAVMDGPRYLFWNFVASSRERLEQAKADQFPQPE